jgi:hypothetical protein
MQRLFVSGVLLVLFGCAYNPNYDGIHCGEERECPEGYICIGPGESGRCLQPNPVDGEDGGSGDDGYDGADVDYDYDHDHDYDYDHDHDRDGEDGGDIVTGDDGPVCQPEQEICDDLDNDCDGTTDGITRGCNVEHQGVCAVGSETCTAGIWAGCPLAGDELCDPPGADENCDGSVDEGCECMSGQARDCPLQMGVCAGSEEVCADYQWPGCDYLAYDPDYEPAPEQSCDGIDNDCDDSTDGMTRSCNIDHVGQCAVGTETCTDAVWGGCPQPEQEECDGIDNDCDDELDSADGDLQLPVCVLNQGVCTGTQYHDPGKCVDGQWWPCDHVEYGSDYGAEACYDGLDNDCDGLIDCGPPACEGNTRVCYNECLEGQQTCENGAWTACNAPAKQDETSANGNCGDGLDNDCDGSPDCADGDCDGFERECWKQCFSGHQHCESGSWTGCDARDPSGEYFGCFCCSNGIDDDCDGNTDWDDPDC